MEFVNPMAIEVKLPELGEGVESGDVLEILVQEGDVVSQDQGLLELETDKATVTVPSPAAGRIAKLLVEPGQTVAVGQVVAHIEAGEAASEAEPPPTPSQGVAESVPTEAAAPAPTAEPSVESKPAEVGQQAAAEEPSVAAPRPQPVATGRSPSATAPMSGGTQTTAGPAAGSGQAAAVPGDDVPAGPAVRRLAREVGIDLRTVKGTGPGGRITREDVLRAVRAMNQSRQEAASVETQLVTTSPHAQTQGGANQVARPGEPGHDEYGPVRVERLSKIRKTIAAQMHRSWSTVPRVTNFDDADVTELEALRGVSKEDYAEQGIKLTTMPFVIKAVAMALKHHPTINAMLDLEREQIVYRDYVNIGIAVDTPRGLVVPNIRNADQLSIAEIARALSDLAVRVRNGDFGVNELRGGTFSISNLGAIGGTYSTPIVNVPEVAILLLGRSRKLPVVMGDDSIVPRLMMPLSLSYDHRLVDGGTAARFLNDVIEYLETPTRLLLAI